MLRAAVIGAGRFGRWHIEKWQALAGAELVAIADPKPEQDRFGVRFTTDWRELLGTVDAVSIATPTLLHAEIATAFLDAGAHVFVEKPITADVASARRLVERADAAGLVLQVGHVERFNPAWTHGRPLIGRARHVEMLRAAPFQPRSLDISVVLDLMIHDLDLLLDVATAPLVSVDAFGQRVLSGQLDRVHAHLRFADGLIADVAASRVGLATERHARFVEDDGRMVEIDFQNRKVTEVRPNVDRMEAVGSTFDPVDTVRAELAAFVATIQGEQPCTVPGEAGLRALELALAVEQAAA